MAGNFDERTVRGFGYEWSSYDQSRVDDAELQQIFEAYFSLFPWASLPPGAVGVDLGCGSGRWAARVAPRVGTLHCVDASAAALLVARRLVGSAANVRFHEASVDALPFEDGSLDFAYSLGVLHHVPDTAAAIRTLVRKLKPGAPLLLYLYYALDNRPLPYRLLWRGSDAVRRVVSRLPLPLRRGVAEGTALGVYWPLARTAAVLERLGRDPASLPLAFYRDKSLFTMRTDAYDRLGTPLERRFTREEMASMMTRAGLEQVTFREGPPYWCAVGLKRA